ncbi:hypothetical protein ACHAPF_001134 [Botrytis cinerea]
MRDVLSGDERDGESVAGTSRAADLPVRYFAPVTGGCAAGSAVGEAYYTAGAVAALARCIAVDGIGVDAIRRCGQLQVYRILLDVAARLARII